MTDDQIDQLKTKDGQKILRLSDVFEHYGTSVNYIIELKANDVSMVEAFRSTVDASKLEDHIIVQSFEGEILQRLEDVYPQMPKMYLLRTQAELDKAMQEPWPDILAPAKGLMNKTNCDAVHESDKQFCTWVLDTEREIRTAISLGVDSYFTNDTKLAIALEETYRNAEGQESVPETSEVSILLASDYQAENGDSTGYTKYDDFLEAVETGKGLQAAIQAQIQHSDKTEKEVRSTLASQITSKYKDQYVQLVRAGRTGEAANLQARLLTAYEALGYNRAKKLKDIQKWLK